MISREGSAWHAGDVRVQEVEPARESVMTEVMEIDEAHAIDHRSCVRVLIMRCDTGFTVLNPAYQNPDR
jgi:hypothetical protein